MKIERDTWHSRRFHRWRASLPVRHKWSLQQETVRSVSLCPYFWIVMVFAPLARVLDWLADESDLPDKDWRAALTFCAAIAMTVWFVGLIVGLIVALVVGLVVDWLETLKTLAIVAGCGVGSLIVIGGLGLAIEKRKERRERKNLGRPKAPPLVKEWAKAKHRRICPLIEFEERA